MKVGIEKSRKYRIHSSHVVLVTICAFATFLLVIQVVLYRHRTQLRSEIPYSPAHTTQPSPNTLPNSQKFENGSRRRTRRVLCPFSIPPKPTIFTSLPFLSLSSISSLLPRSYFSSPSISFTHNPMFSSSSSSLSLTSPFESVIYISKHPIGFAIDAFQKEYQVILSNEMMKTDVFKSFVMGKVVLWRVHFMYWFRKRVKRNTENENEKHMTWHVIKVENLVRNFQDGHDQIRRWLFGDVVECLWLPYAHILDDADEGLLVESVLEHSMDEDLKQAVYEMTKPWLCLLGYGIGQGDSCEGVDESWLDRFEKEGEFWIKEREQKKKVSILTTYFEAESKERQDEIDAALRENVNHASVDQVYIWIQGPLRFPDGLQMEKIQVMESPSQPLYRELFDFANKHLPGSIVIIQNSDIYWTPTLELVHTIHPGMVYAISRQTNVSGFPLSQCPDLQGHNSNFCDSYHGSHDAFIYQTPIDISMTRDMTFKQNTWGAENVVISALKWGGWRVENPCFDIVAVHVHCSGVRINTGGHIEPLNGRGLDSRTARPRPLSSILN